MGPISSLRTEDSPLTEEDCLLVAEEPKPFAEGMEGAIFRAISPRTGTPLALKAYTSFKSYRNRESPLEEEYKIAAEIAHPNIVKVYFDKSCRPTTLFSSSSSVSATPLLSPIGITDSSKDLNGFLVMEMILGLNLDDIKTFASEGEKLSVAMDFVTIHEHVLRKGYWNFDLTSVNFMLRDSSLIAIDIGCFAKIPLEIVRASASIFDVSMLLHEILAKRPYTSVRGWDHAITKLFSDYHMPLCQANVTQMQEFLDMAKRWLIEKQ